MDVAAFLETIRRADYYSGQIEHVEILPERPARYAEPARPLPERVGFSLRFQRRMAEEYRPYWVWNAAVELDVPGVVDDSGLGRRERWQGAFYRHLRAIAPRDP